MTVSLENFTPIARACLEAARREAQAYQSRHVEPEHVLLALLAPESGSAWNVLAGTLGNPLRLRNRIVKSLKESPASPESASPEFGFRTDRALHEASDEALRSGMAVDTPHLLLGLLDEGGAAANILRQAGLDASRLRHWLRQRAQHSEPVQPAPLAPRTRAKPQRAVDDLPLRQALPRLISWYAVLVQVGIVGVGVWLSTQPEFETAGVVFIVFGGWVISLCAHEFAHALAGDLGGDRGVRERGYLSFNPLSYTHVLLSIVLPIVFLFIGGLGLPGGAVYIDRARLRSSRWGSLVSAAGPLASLLMAVLWALPLALGRMNPLAMYTAPGLWGALSLLVVLNVWGVLFNLLPIPPLDGFGIIAPWLPSDLVERLYMFGFVGSLLIVYLMMSVQPLSESFWGAVYDVVQTLGVDPGLAAYGLSRFMFWR